MNRINIELNGRILTYRAPSSWDEMGRKAIFAWAGILRQAVDGVDDAMDAAVMLLYGIPVDLLARLNIAQRMQLADSLAFLRKNELTSNAIGKLRILGRTYHGPAGRLANLTIGEYRRTEIYYQLWLKTGETKLLRLLAATLFRPKAGKHSTMDDIREPLNEDRIARRAGVFRLLHPNWLRAVLLYYEGCRGTVIRRFPRVFVKPAEGEAAADDRAWRLVDLDGHILAYSGDKLGNYRETMETGMYVFFKHMTQRMEEYERLQRERSKQ